MINGKKKIVKMWTEMKSRCNDPAHPSFKSFGGQGIGYQASCENFETFSSDMPLKYRSNVILVRLNEQADYSKDNCFWKDVLNPNVDIEACRLMKNEQQSNRSHTFRGKVNDSVGFSRMYNIDCLMLQKRLSRGWTIDRAMTEALRKRRTLVKIK